MRDSVLSGFCTNSRDFMHTLQIQICRINKVPSRVPLMTQRRRSRGQDFDHEEHHGSRECRLKQCWCSETETGLSSCRAEENERGVCPRESPGSEFFLSITKRNSPALALHRRLRPRLSLPSLECPSLSLPLSYPYTRSVTPMSFLRDLYRQRTVGQ